MDTDPDTDADPDKSIIMGNKLSFVAHFQKGQEVLTDYMDMRLNIFSGMLFITSMIQRQIHRV